MFLLASCTSQETTPVKKVQQIEQNSGTGMIKNSLKDIKVNETNGNIANTLETKNINSGSIQCIRTIENASGPNYSPDSKSFFYMIQKNRKWEIVNIGPE